MTTEIETNIPKPNKTRKRLMYVTRDDFYFLTYNAFLLLKELKCTKKENPFIDIRKLAFTIEFTSDFNLIDIAKRCKDGGNKPTDKERALLSSAYARSQGRLAFINRLMIGLEKKGYVCLIPNNDKKILDVYLNMEKVPTTFFENDLFESETKNIANLRSISSRIRTTSLSAFLDTVFRTNGVSTWLD